MLKSSCLVFWIFPAMSNRRKENMASCLWYLKLPKGIYEIVCGWMRTGAGGLTPV